MKLGTYLQHVTHTKLRVFLYFSLKNTILTKISFDLKLINTYNSLYLFTIHNLKFTIKMIFFRLIFESFNFAWQALRANVLRTALSLLGVTVGIFSIIAVYTIVDSLERSIKQSLNFLGDKVLYVQKWPWSFGPDYPWWKYMNRPIPDLEEFRFLEKKATNASAVAIMVDKSNVTLKAGNLSMAGTDVSGVSHSYEKVSDVLLAQGRYFSVQESDRSQNVAIIGDQIAKDLFPRGNAIGGVISVKGLKMNVIGVMKREGESFLGGNSKDVECLIPYGYFSKIYKVGKNASEPTISLKGYENDANLTALEDELRALMRAKRSLKPRDEDSFALNRPEMIANQVGAIFGVLNVAGGIIGGLSILVGAFGIANIMFVSVKERTNIIGIQKSLGAKNYFILFQFLFEAVFLSVLGGIVGLFLVYLITIIPQDSLELLLSTSNIITGLAISSVVGMLSGIIPAYIASRMDPVEAIRAK